MPEAVAEFRRARSSGDGWMLGRFLCPASRSAELAALLGPGQVGAGLVLDAGPETLAAAAAQVRVESVEARLGAEPSNWREETERMRAEMLPAARVHFEVPFVAGWDEEVPRAIALLAEAGMGAKVRCGGDSVPSPEQLALLVSECAAQRVACKATAGLHHAVRGVESGSSRPHHGFLNLLAAAAFALDRDASPALLADVLSDDDPCAFGLHDESFSWRGAELSVPAIARTRRELLVSFGSCSFDEPVAELRALGLLAE
jgi:hypothetical protein